MSAQKKRIDDNMEKMLNFQEFFGASRKITENWGTGLRKQRAWADQGTELALELINKIKEFHEFCGTDFWIDEGRNNIFKLSYSYVQAKRVDVSDQLNEAIFMTTLESKRALFESSLWNHDLVDEIRAFLQE
jgi:hypothetical protein